MLSKILVQEDKPDLSAEAANITWDRFQELELDKAGLSPGARQFADLHTLYEKIGDPATSFGKLTLIDSLCNPPTTDSEVARRRDAIEELCSNPTLRETLRERLKSLNEFNVDTVVGTDILLTFLSKSQAFPKNIEKSFKTVLQKYGQLLFDQVYPVRKFADLNKAILNLKNDLAPQSEYLTELLGKIRDADETFLARQLRLRKFVVAPGSLDPLQEKKPWIYSFWAKRGFDPLQTAYRTPYILGIGHLIVMTLAGYESKSEVSSRTQVIMLPILTAIVMLPLVYESVKRRSLFDGLSRQYKANRKLVEAIDAVGELDKLVSLSDFQSRYSSKYPDPRYRQTDSFSIKLKNARSPVLTAEKGEDAVVPSQIEFGRGNGKVLTGKNSGGKTNWATTALHELLLVLNGVKPLSDDTEIEIPDQIFLLSQESFVHSKHGSFGSELEEVRKILESATPRSLIIFDEVGSATREIEAAPIYYKIIKAAQEIGATVLVITHNNPLLAERLGREPGLSCIKPGIDEQNVPTYIFSEGLADSSGAAEIAAATKTDEESLRDLLLSKGIQTTPETFKW